MEPKITVEPDAWATKVECIGPEYGKTTYGKLPKQSLNPLYYSHEKLYSEKTVIGLMKAAYYDGYTDREEEVRKSVECIGVIDANCADAIRAMKEEA